MKLTDVYIFTIKAKLTYALENSDHDIVRLGSIKGYCKEIRSVITSVRCNRQKRKTGKATYVPGSLKRIKKGCLAMPSTLGIKPQNYDCPSQRSSSSHPPELSEAAPGAQDLHLASWAQGSP